MNMVMRVNKLQVASDIKILLPANNYVFENDTRLLIPFTSGEKIGFMNSQQEIVLNSQFSMYYGDCYNVDDLVKVAVTELYGYPRANGKVSVYSKPLYGLINHLGEFIIPPENIYLLQAKGSSLVTLQNKEGKYGVVDIHCNEIVPFGKYSWIDGFDKGLARVNVQVNDKSEIGCCRKYWGIIDEKGNEVLPLVYDDIWNFFNKNRTSTNVVKNGVSKQLDLRLLNPSLSQSNHSVYGRCSSESEHYGEYSGSYAQDVMGYSDEVINDAFDGEPDAYWNID